MSVPRVFKLLGIAGWRQMQSLHLLQNEAVSTRLQDSACKFLMPKIFFDILRLIYLILFYSVVLIM